MKIKNLPGVHPNTKIKNAMRRVVLAIPSDEVDVLLADGDSVQLSVVGCFVNHIDWQFGQIDSQNAAA